MAKMDPQEKRIAKLLGQKKIPQAENETLKRYLDYLKQHLEFPCHLTGTEDLGCFSWEEYYTFGPGSEEEYGELNKKRASYTDTYELLSFDADIDPNYGIFANVRRLSDKKKFVLPLSDLEASEKESSNYQLLDDFSVWFVNWQ